MAWGSDRVGVLALVLVAMMLMTGVVAFATAAADQVGNYTLTVTDNRASRSYKAYQIFYGTLVAGENKLGDIEWGTGVTEANMIAAIEGYSGAPAGLSALIKGTSPKTLSAQEVSEYLSTLADDSADLNTFAKIVASATKADPKTLARNAGGTAYEATGLKNGYYFVQDETTLATDADDTVTRYILKVVNNVTVAKKVDQPDLIKKVKDNTTLSSVDNHDAARLTDIDLGTDYNDTADYNVGDSIPFEMFSKVPDMTYYDSFKFVVTDTFSESLTLNQTSSVYDVQVKIGAYDAVLNTDYTLSYASDVMTITFTNAANTGLKGVVAAHLDAIKSGATTLSEVAGETIKITYSATLNEKAKLGQQTGGNTNTVQLTYTHNPNDNSDGKTTEDKVIIFTYELDTLKVDAAVYEAAYRNSLKTYLTTKGTITAEATEDQLTAAITTLEASDDAANKAAVAAAITAAKAAKTLHGAEFVLYRLQADGSTKEYVILDSNDVIDFDSANGTKGWTTDLTKATTLTTPAGGKFAVKGLDDGTYYLKETKAPTGYNLLTSDITVVITANTSNSQSGAGAVTELTELNVTANGKAGSVDLTNGIGEITVGNNQGAELPSTGGIGTTIFYVAGSIMVLAAAILLITKRRMGNND